MTEAQIQSVALFYYFVTLDESVSLVESERTLLKVESRLKKSTRPHEEIAPLIVYFTQKGWNKLRRRKQYVVTQSSVGSGFLIPDEVDMSSWVQFKKEADESEFLAVLWSRVLKFRDDEISIGLGVTVGTIRHRVSRGLRKLGAIHHAKESTRLA